MIESIAGRLILINKAGWVEEGGDGGGDIAGVPVEPELEKVFIEVSGGEWEEGVNDEGMEAGT